MGTNGCVVITGGAGALGGAVARRIARDGRAVVLLDAVAHLDRARAVAGGIEGRAIAIGVDVAEAGALGEALAKVPADFGDVTGAALIAGGYQGGAPVHEEEASTWSAMTRANLDTAHASLRALLPGMVARKHGSVVVIGSRAVERPWTSANAAAYSATKAAVVALARTAAAEVLEHGVRINAILPSTLDTPANRRAMPDADPSRWVALDSCASVIAFLLSDEARDVSGATLPVYGRA